VYMAYGRDAQAEEILKDAIVKEPKRYELHLKLLEIYQTSGNTSAFETISGELYTTLGASDPVWAKVAQLGIKLDPDNPLYKVEEQPQNVEDGNDFELVGDAVSTDKDDFFASFGNVEDGASETMLDSPSAEEKLDLASNSTTISNVVEPSPFDLDLGALDFDMDTPTQEVREESDQTPTILQDEVTDHSEDVLSFDNETTELDDFSDGLTAENAENSMMEVDFDEAPKSDENEPSLPEVIEIEADETPNFDIAIEDAHDLSEPSDLGMSMAEPPSFDLTDINLDLNDLSGDGASQSAISAVEPEEVETKLDLVMAYLDMEDKIGAKELLEEVLKEGGENQRRRASELLEKIG
ncbi:MAG: hypothetical protein B7Y32_04955, partial [Methylophilales bacterium 16-45-7]